MLSRQWMNYNWDIVKPDKCKGGQMKKIIQRAISLGVLVLVLFGLDPLNTVGAAANYATSPITESWLEGQASDSLATYQVNQGIGQLQKTLLQGKIIVIDPGHGGSDTGAIGSNNTFEKQVTLTVAQELRKLLVTGGATVIMTRTSDRDVAYIGASDKEELQARIDIANRVNADLFVSIHADAFAGSAGGTTTYFSDKTGDNIHLAQLVQENMVAQLNLYDRGIRQNDYYILEHADMPAILTEVAFISNPQEEKLLTNRYFDRKAAVGIFNGIKQHFQAL